MSFAQWHRKRTVPPDSCDSHGLSLSVCLSLSQTHTHTHTHTGRALDTRGLPRCQHAKESSFCSVLISLWVPNWQLRGAEHSHHERRGCIRSLRLHSGVLMFQLLLPPGQISRTFLAGNFPACPALLFLPLFLSSPPHLSFCALGWLPGLSQELNPAASRVALQKEGETPFQMSPMFYTDKDRV